MIEINNLTTSKIDEKFLKRIARKVLKGENKEGIDLSIALVGQTRIRKLNKKYRGKNRATDVLSFGNGLNEIVICLREVKKQELAQVLIHGILHLLGYEHEKSEAETEKMEEKEEYYLTQVIAE